MDKKELHNVFESNLSSLMSQEDNHIPSMRYLSTCIGASESYIQKLLNTDSFPSFEKMVAISEHYGIDPWMLLFDYGEHSKHILALIQMISQCPPELIPAITNMLNF